MDRARGLPGDHRAVVLSEIARQSAKATKKAREDVTRILSTLGDACARAVAVYAASARAIEEGGDALPDADAERGGAALVPEPDHVGEQRGDDPSAGAPDGVSERDGAA